MSITARMTESSIVRHPVSAAWASWSFVLFSHIAFSAELLNVFYRRWPASAMWCDMVKLHVLGTRAAFSAAATIPLADSFLNLLRNVSAWLSRVGTTHAFSHRFLS
jgi:hypothetical protein